MKLNSKRPALLAGETTTACATRKQYNRAKRTGNAPQRKRAAFLRTFQVFEIGTDAAALDVLKASPCKSRSQLISALKTCGKA